MSWENNVRVTLHNDSTENVYTGDIVTGIITLDLKKDLTVDISGIDLEIIGISKAQWTRFTPTTPYLRIYSEKKKIFYVKQTNLFYENIQADKSIRAGMYSYPFHFALPPNLPSTFKSSIASVSYYIQISKPHGKVKKNIPFNVLTNVNLNNNEDLLKPCEYEFMRKFRCKDKVKVCLRTYKCFAPRQIISFEVTLRNENKVKINKINIALVQKLRYTVYSGYADEEKKICDVDYKNMENKILEICNFAMEIPQVAPSSINTTEPMIDISYELRVEVFFSYHTNLIENIPVTVAAVPVIHSEL